MGMAASQARLLTLTARLTDNELRSQTINNAKMRLATESSQASEAYVNALNNATLKFTNYDETGAALTQPLTYNSLMAYSSYNTQYGLINSSGQILVSESEAAMFQAANGDINKYLKAHGLEFTTTYFDEIGSIENETYPEPFKNITNTELQKWYEEYGSYENSIEVETYKNAYSNYKSAKNSLTHALDNVLGDYFGAGTIGTGEDEERFPGGYAYNQRIDTSAETFLKNLKSAYSNPTNKYSFNNETTQKFISGLKENNGSARTAIENLLKSYDVDKDNGNLIVNQSESINLNVNELTIEDYTLTITDGKVTQVTNNEDGIIKYGENEYTFSESNPTWIPPTVIGSDGSESQPDLATFLSNFQILENFASSKFSLDNNTLKTTTTYTDENAKIGEIKNLNQKIITILKENLNYETFGKMIINGEISGITLTAGVQQYVDDCINYKEDFLNTIFKDKNTEYQFPQTDIEGKITSYQQTTINEAIDNGIIKMNNLMNEEYVLWLAANSKDASGNDLTEETSFISENFKTVIKTFIIENTIIENFGTPKYAWVDEMDTQNKGNADSKAQWYTNLYKRMEKGFKTLENGLASSQQWIEYALESGLVTMEQVDKSFNWQSLEYKTCTRITEVTDDAAVAKAEAEYNRAMNDIKTKDNMYDIQLKNIDTEHTSLQTEYDSIKQVITKNIERTFKFDQSA